MLRESVGQEFGRCLAEWFWLQVLHVVAIRCYRSQSSGFWDSSLSSWSLRAPPHGEFMWTSGLGVIRLLHKGSTLQRHVS